MKTRLILILIMPVLFEASSVQAATFQGLGFLEGASWSQAFGVSDDGLVIVGSSDSEAFRWKDGVITGLGDLAGGSYFSCAYETSADSSVVVGYSSDGVTDIDAFRWTQEDGIVGFGDYLSSETIEGTQTAQDVSADGLVVVGSGRSTAGSEGFRWTANEGMIGLGDLHGGIFQSYALSTSSDGSVVVGHSTSAFGVEAFRWTSDSNMVGLGELSGGSFYSNAFHVSADGSIIIGCSESTLGMEAFRWENIAMVGLGDLNDGSFYSEAMGLSDDGSVIVGFSDTGNPILAAINNSTELLGVEAFIWDVNNGMRNLKDVLENDYDLDLAGWILSHATDISADGLTIVGDGTNPDGNIEGWVARLECEYLLAGDINNDCKVDFLDFAMLAETWLTNCSQNPLDPACIPK